MEIYTLAEIMSTAETLFDPTDLSNVEYARGVCELIGRLRLDIGGIVEGTGENAIEIAHKLNVKIR